MTTVEDQPGPEPAVPRVVETGAGVADQRRSRRPRRLVSYLVTLFFLVTLNFFLPRALPGDPIDAMVASRSSPSSPSYLRDERTREGLLRYYGLDRPLLEQYVRYLGATVRGDLGYSIRYSKPVSSLVAERLPWTVLLGSTAIALGALFGLIPGVHSGWRRGRAIDRTLLGFFIGVRNFPPFFLASLALFVFAVKLRWVPVAGAVTPFSSASGLLAQAVDILHHLVLPASVMALQIAAYNYLIMRSGMVAELGADHLLMARVKGLPERWIKYRYAARNALLPVVTVTALQLGFALTLASVFVEAVFAYPGMGRLVSDSTALRDYPALQGCFLVFGVIVLTTNFCADALYARLDPRTRT